MARSTAAALFLVIAAGCGGDEARGDASVTPCGVGETHDEDGDGIVDVCDNCPTAANSTQLDTSEQDVRAFADGVGNACDLRPGGSGDDLYALYTFETDPGGFRGWTIEGDAAHASGEAAWTSPHNPMLGDGLAVRAELASVAMLDPAGGVTIALDGDGVAYGRTCTLHASELVAAEIHGASAAEMLSPPIAAGEPVVLIGWRIITGAAPMRTAQLICRVVRGASVDEANVTLGDDFAIGTHAIAAADADAVLTALSVYTSPGPKNP